MFLAVAALALIGGCGGAAGSAAPSPDASAAKDKKYQVEAAKADCMKKKGFKYVAFVQEWKKLPKDEKRAVGDYQAMREYREKRGFGVFDQYVYPDESNAQDAGPESNPNGKIQSSLNRAQLGAYDKALDSCAAAAIKQVLGLTVKSDMDYLEQAGKAADRAIERTLNSDPTLVRLASAMATCLKGKGYSPGEATPKAMVQNGLQTFQDLWDRLGREQRDDVPDAAPPRKDGEPWTYYRPTLTPEQAKPYLQREIKAALDDLECGRDFYPAYLPKDKAVQEQVGEQYPL
ncbi:hypothetical protein [Nonomuraea sp. NEAU-A123]|uniref:hypothetical protein n=1 Tax=Nonomuraea sp. NEAU-A123 TaxID=2839649 RepID=UPI001BE3D842|nr:hypothetical protein [Nonomuraea sp. NEAU-A123]MBT2231539.1 hypothetical protein [Nonomuraea sp. NEAU-A123]